MLKQNVWHHTLTRTSKQFFPNPSIKLCVILGTERPFAEFCSGIEMLQAAKRTSNTNLAGGFIRHALDEYRHAYLFSSLAKNIACRNNLIGMQRFLPKHAFIKRYLNRSSYLFESMSFDRFTIFVAISEKYAADHFSDVLDRETVFNCEEKDILKSILIDEGRHDIMRSDAPRSLSQS